MKDDAPIDWPEPFRTVFLVGLGIGAATIIGVLAMMILT